MSNLAGDYAAVRRTIAIYSRTWSQGQINLMGLLESVLPVRFTVKDSEPVDSIGELKRDRSKGHGEIGEGLSSLTIASAEPRPPMRGVAIQFSDEPEVPFPFRGRKLEVKIAIEPSPIWLMEGERVLAEVGNCPVWTVRSESEVSHFRSAFELPELGPTDSLFDVFNGERWVELLPLLHWIKVLNSDRIQQSGSLRACFIFDDPNLHYPTYGFVNFRELAIRGTKNHYHVSFATIPLDAWYTNPGAANLFRSFRQTLSLCVHGNNHTKEELGGPTTSERTALLSQAKDRIMRLERRSGLEVARVMVPPHGVCSEEVLADLPRFGFESVCVSHASLRAHNRSRGWTRKLGLSALEVIRGCPILPRWSMTGPVQNCALLAAYLDQPMIFRGHHQDLRDGVEILDTIAQCVNGIGNVTWSNLGELSRMNLRWRMQAGTLIVRPSARRVELEMPNEATMLVIERGSEDWGVWKLKDPAGIGRVVPVGLPISIPGGMNRKLRLECTSIVSAGAEPVTPRLSIRALVRRILTEGRDRFLRI